MAIARGEARSIAFHDCDIKTYDENILIKLFYPLLNDSMGYSFSKGFYPRYAHDRFNGRVTRLLVTPLIKSLIKLFGNNDYLEFIDSFRYINKEPHHYSWWSYRANSRANNKGWRIDYNMVSKSIEERIVNASILSDIHHSDHCPIKLELSL